LYSVNPHFLCNISTKDPNFHTPSEEEEEIEEEEEEEEEKEEEEEEEP